jgi:DNA-binding transcriptional ArsR family regulator
MENKMGKTIKDPKVLERIVKGFANYRRIQILFLLKEEKGLSVMEIAEKLHIGFRSASQHLDKMYRGGIVGKTPEGPSMVHYLTIRGDTAINFLSRFQRY